MFFVRFLNFRPTGDLIPRDEIVMNSKYGKATILSVHLKWQVLGPNAFYINPLGVTMVAANEDGMVIAQNTLYDHIDELEASRATASIAAFIDENFVDGTVTTLVATDLYVLRKYLEQNAPEVVDRLATTSYIDMDTLREVLPRCEARLKGVLVVGAGFVRFDAIMNLESYMHFKQAHAGERHMLSGAVAR